MRAALALIAFAACTPEIASQAYLCGPEELCPDGQACNGGDNVCVTASEASAFSCTSMPGDDTPATGRSLGPLACVSAPMELDECLPQDDTVDWYQFDVPSGCVAVEVDARLVFPVAYQGLSLGMAVDGVETAAPDVDCVGSAASGSLQLCTRMTLSPGKHYAIEVVRGGNDDCGGKCAFNRYALTVQLETP
jgi:hypothetical protein